MTPKKFDEIVEARAQQRVKEKVNRFKATIHQAFKELHPSFDAGYGRRASATQQAINHAIFRDLLGIPQTPEKPSGYPPILWDAERDSVRQSLLDTLDEMAKALIAPPPTDIPATAEFTDK